MYVIEQSAPPTTPIDWYHVGLRETLAEAIEAVEYYSTGKGARKCECCQSEFRYRKV